MTTDPLRERLAQALEGRYTLIRELGHGGMGSVYLAVDAQLGREVALKVLPPSTRDFLGPERFQREVHLAAQLTHPHIVPVFEAGEADGLLYYAMGYVAGESLQDRLAREGPLSLEDALRITTEVGDALQYAHERGIIHRDVKPANILLLRGHALVADFGIAKLATGSSGPETLTATGMSIGTAEYMSPEQATGEKRIDARTDVYALAGVLYEMLVGEPPFTGPTVQAIVARVIADPPRPVRTIRPTIPPHVEQALLAALAKVPGDRPASTRAFVDRLTRPSRERPAAWPRRRPWIAAAGGVAVLAAIGWVITLVVGPSLPVIPDRPAGMVLVPGGEFEVGGLPHRPPERVYIDSFYLDSTEVTVAAYAQFLTTAPRRIPWRTVTDSNWPATGVLWEEAVAFCRWRDSAMQLPTENQWEAAARGPDGRRYPWGTTWASGRANADGVLDTLAPVGAFPLGRSWVGAVDLIGNAWEWTASATRGRAGENVHVIKGGSFNADRAVARATFRAWLADSVRAVYNTGFRCARDARP